VILELKGELQHTYNRTHSNKFEGQMDFLSIDWCFSLACRALFILDGSL